MGFKNCCYRFMSIILFSAITVTSLGCNFNVRAENKDETSDVFYPYSSIENAEYNCPDYNEYISAAGDKVSDKQIHIDAGAYTGNIDASRIFNNYDGQSGVSVSLSENESVTWNFHVEKEGLYTMSVLYYPYPGYASPIQANITIDGVQPFNECEVVTFDRIWTDAKGEKQFDTQNNEMLPTQIETPEWITSDISDDTGNIDMPFNFYLTAGTHTVTLSGIRDIMLIKSIDFIPASSVPEYKQVYSEYMRLGYKSVSEDAKCIIQAENASAKSDQMLYPQSDRTSPSVQPYDAVHTRYNTIGGQQWKSAGQWIEWDVDLSESGLYTIAMHFKQALKTDGVSVRQLYIDGKLPFAEARAINFLYNGSWQTKEISDENGEAYQFYLTEGKHTIRLCVGLGDNAEIISQAREYITELNRIYREIAVITGVNPDMYRNYNLDTAIPDTLENMKTMSKKLKELEEKIASVNNDGTKNCADIKRLYIQLDSMAADCDTIPSRFSNFKDNISSLGTWVNNAASQPLELDYFVLKPVKSELEKGNAGFLSMVKHYFLQFIASFVTDYASIGELSTDYDREITVWQTTGRDQAKILNSLINNSFTPEYGISVDSQLVAAGSLMPATLAGIGPDVCLNIDQTTPMNLALRNAVVNLLEYDDITGILNQFEENTLESFRFNGGLYAVPETLTYPMLFYRKDIISELNINLSDLETWDKVLENVLPTLQKSSLSFGILPSLNNYLMFLYQNGGSLYIDDNKKSGLNTQNAVKAMNEYASLYTQFGLSLSFDFANRFRSGETPIAIADFTAYNQLTVFAPEISRLWGMLPVPGMVREDGSVDHSCAAVLTGSIMLAQSKDKEAAAKFLKWWASNEIQSEYGKKIESVVGSAARYNTANIQAFKTVQWDSDVKQNLMYQLNFVRATPEVPGGYFTVRLYDFAFRDIVYDNEEIRETLIDAVSNIDQEMKTKREEYGLE